MVSLYSHNDLYSHEIVRAKAKFLSLHFMPNSSTHWALHKYLLKKWSCAYPVLKAFSCPLMQAAGCPLVPHAPLSEAASYRYSHVWLCLWSRVCSMSLVFIAGLHSEITMTDCTWTTYKCINCKANYLCILHIFPQKLGHPCFLFNICPLPELTKLESWDAIHS